jgi:hypothetical protein
MALETGTYISDLVATNPTASDPVAQGDDHLRLLKSAVKATLPNLTGAMTASQAELNRLDGANWVFIDRNYAEYTTNADIASAIPLDDTIPQVGEGTQILSAAITPKSASNRVRVRFQGQVFSAGAALNVIAALFVNGGADAVRATYASTGGAGFATQLVIEYEHVPGATSAQTYTIRVGSQGGTAFRMNGAAARLFGGVSAATITVEELAV